jgi:putative glycosyltransferase
MKISIVAPLYRSAPYIEALHGRCVDSIHAIGSDDYEIIFVNDGSPDEGVEIAKRIAVDDPGVVVVDLARNYGQHRAIMVGLEHATGDFVFVLDSDLEDEPEWLIRFHEEMTRTGCDVVYGVQVHKKRGALYRFGRNAFFRTMRVLSGATFRENMVNARLMKRRFVDAVLQFREREIFIDGIWEMCGFTQLPLSVVKHDTSPTNYTFARLAAMAINGITSFSTRPLIAIAALGVAACLLAFGYTAHIVLRQAIYGIPVEGWPSLMAAVLSIGGLTILCNGIMAIYIAMIFSEVKQRPLAVVKDVYRSESKPGTPQEGRITGKRRQTYASRARASAQWRESGPTLDA